MDLDVVLMTIIKNSFFVLLILITTSCSHDTQDMVFIEEGEFIMGSDEVDEEGLAKKFGSLKGEFFLDERPKRFIYIHGYYIDKFEVTNSDYQLFVASTGEKSPLGWQGTFYPKDSGNLPVVNITLTSAEKFCRWKDKRLPTEQEWEKAARGPKGLSYPWGNDFDDKKGNLNTQKLSPVGSYPLDKSYYGVYDMAGNVIEYVNGYYMPYSKKANNGNKLYGKKYSVARGGLAGISGHYTLNKIFSRGAYRHFVSPYNEAADTGFRCAKSIK